MNPLQRYILRSKVAFLGVILPMLFLFSVGGSSFGNDNNYDRETGIVTWENWKKQSTGFPAWSEGVTRSWGEQVEQPDGTQRSVTIGVESSGRIIWTSPAWLYPILGIVLFWVRENWLLRDARKAGASNPPHAEV